MTEEKQTFTSAGVVAALQSFSFRYASEFVLHSGIAFALENRGIPCVREYPFSIRDRIDFWLPTLGLGIEVKIEGSMNSIARQLKRYAEYDQVKEIILATTRRKHISIPRELNGKPIHFVLLGAHQL